MWNKHESKRKPSARAFFTNLRGEIPWTKKAVHLNEILHYLLA
jgi:hypothetical protein